MSTYGIIIIIYKKCGVISVSVGALTEIFIDISCQ